MKYANRTTKVKRKLVEVTLGEDTFRLQEMNGLERDHYELAVIKRVSINGSMETDIERLLLRSRLVVMCWIDEAGNRIYRDDEVEAFAVEYPASIITSLFEAAQKLNGMDAGAVEVAAKNSASVPAGASPSDLH